MLHAMVDGVADPIKLADMARAKLRKKIPQLQVAFEGRFGERHRFQIRELLAQLEFLDAGIADYGQQIQERSSPFQPKIELLMTIPGVDWITASGILAEIGPDMTQFPSAAHLASWAGLCPGNNESAGKSYSGKTRKGSRWLRSLLCQTAWAASHTRSTYLSTQFRRLAAKRGKQRAIVALAHSILVAAFYILQRNEPYREAGADYFERKDPTGLQRYLVRRLERLGNKVTLEPAVTN